MTLQVIFWLYLDQLSLATVATHRGQQDENERKRTKRTHLHAPRVPETFIINKLFMKNEWKGAAKAGPKENRNYRLQFTSF